MIPVGELDVTRVFYAEIIYVLNNRIYYYEKKNEYYYLAMVNNKCNVSTLLLINELTIQPPYVASPHQSSYKMKPIGKDLSN